MIKLDTAIEINQQESSCLVIFGFSKRNAKFDGSNGNSSFFKGIRAIKYFDLLLPFFKVRINFDLIPNLKGAIVENFLPIVGGVGFSSTVIKIALSDDIRR